MTQAFTPEPTPREAPPHGGGFLHKARWIAGHWRPYRREIPLILVLTVANAAILIVYPLLLKRIIDGIEQSLSYAYLVHHVFILLGYGAAHFAVYASLQTLRARLNLRFEFGVRMRAFEHLLEAGAATFRRFRTGDLVTRLMDDVGEKLSWFMCSVILRLVEAALVIAFGVAAMLWIDPLLTLCAAGPLPVLVGLFVFTASRLHRRYEEVQQSISHLNDVLESCFSGVRVVKAFAAEPAQRRAVLEAIQRQRRAEIRAVRWQTVIDSLYGNVWQLAIISVLLVGGAMAIEGSVSLGDLVAFGAYVLMLVWPMFDVGQFLVRGKLSAVSIERLEAIEQCRPEVDEPGVASPAVRRPDAPPPADYPASKDRRRPMSVVFKGVGYRFPGAEHDALAGVSFAALPGTITAVVGEVGSGKSALLALAARLVDPASGRVLVYHGAAPADGDGQVTALAADLRTRELVPVRQAIGYVPQEPLLLSGTVLENVRFGRAWIGEEDVEQALDLACLRDDLEDWPDGLHTRLGTRGTRLSGGQKHRVALARALADRPSILLLDDCTAALDAQTEEFLWQGLEEATPHTTTILVTHRPATLRRAGQILVLDRGTVRERGTFADLERPGTLLHRLYLQWTLEEEPLDDGP